MIGKVVKPGKGFAGLIRYLFEGSKDKKSQAVRVAWSATRNLLTEDPKRVAALMRATAAKSKKVKAPVYHFVVSWRLEEQPTPELMERVADTTCDDLGLQDYQRIYVAHEDTLHRHVHIVVNRVHPETGVAWRMSHDFRHIEQSLFRQSVDLGLQPVPGRHTTKLQQQLKSRRPTSPAFRKGQREGEAAPSRWSVPLIAERQAVLRTLVDTSISWQHVHEGLQPLGIQLLPKGMGLVFQDANGQMKLSDLGKGYRLTLLEERFGRYVAAQHEPIKARTRVPTPFQTPISRQLARDTIAMQAAVAHAERQAVENRHQLGLSSEKDVQIAISDQQRMDALQSSAPKTSNDTMPLQSKVRIRRRARSRESSR